MTKPANSAEFVLVDGHFCMWPNDQDASRSHFALLALPFGNGRRWSNAMASRPVLVSSTEVERNPLGQHRVIGCGRGYAVARVGSTDATVGGEPSEKAVTVARAMAEHYVLLGRSL